MSKSTGLFKHVPRFLFLFNLLNYTIGYRSNKMGSLLTQLPASPSSSILLQPPGKDELNLLRVFYGIITFNWHCYRIAHKFWISRFVHACSCLSVSVQEVLYSLHMTQLAQIWSFLCKYQYVNWIFQRPEGYFNRS